METVWRQYGERYFWGDFMVQSLWRLSTNLIHDVLSVNTQHNIQTNFIIRSP